MPFRGIPQTRSRTPPWFRSSPCCFRLSLCHVSRSPKRMGGASGSSGQRSRSYAEWRAQRGRWSVDEMLLGVSLLAGMARRVCTLAAWRRCCAAAQPHRGARENFTRQSPSTSRVSPCSPASVSHLPSPAIREVARASSGSLLLLSELQHFCLPRMTIAASWTPDPDGAGYRRLAIACPSLIT